MAEENRHERKTNNLTQDDSRIYQSQQKTAKGQVAPKSEKYGTGRKTGQKLKTGED